MSTPATLYQPVGIADLLYVKESLTKYQRGDIAHVENVLKSERRLRQHSRKETTETEITTETESITEEERDLQTTDRSEVKRELSQLLKEEASLKAGASLSASYGPTVEFKTYVDGATSSSSEEAQRQAATFSKETVNRAVSKIAEKVAERRRTRVAVELLEANTHEFNNSLSGSKNITGIYQWLSKVYEGQAFSYGKRVLYDITVPEPAAYFLYGLHEGADRKPIDLVKPPPFDLVPSQLNRWNYEFYALQYKVTNVPTPPLPLKNISHSFVNSDTIPAGQAHNQAQRLAIPENYEAISAYIVGLFTFWVGGPNPLIDFVVGSRTWRQTNGASWTHFLTMDQEIGDINVGVLTFDVSRYVASYSILTRLSPTGMSEWQAKAHAAILQGYVQQLRDYERKIEEYATTILPNLFGRPPEENRMIEKIELKKAVTTVFHGQPIDFGSVIAGTGGPEIDLVKRKTDEKIIRFFEQAFEWEQMQYSFYPYYWGRRATWLEKILNRDTDPLFREFMRAGAARVVLSVRPGFEDLVAHYFLTGEVWGGGDLPDITDPAYLPILQEIKESQGQSDATVYGDPWTFTVPTSLVTLRDDGELPRWKKNSDGAWEPEN
ncbi:hypothetical protein RJJ37_29485 [Rhizobium redzepovicii]|uniref:Uncharacterized protein n=1 Tax=Rhizobium redzepovicii TaxID=2867518 RepID=A0AAW8PBU8_9HYPH|nr:hypothetical protein [Rhizobium redzepovicii]MDR9763714.1 hypothetical protein [Rhizobium redzepovicii]